MKSIKRIIVIAGLVVLLASFSGCTELLGTINPLSITERLAAFMVALNADSRSPATILLNFGPEDDMTYYDTAKEDDYWENAFPSANTYAFTAGSDADLTAAPVNGYLTIPVDGALTTSSGGTLRTEYSFTMYQEASGNWLIFSIVEDPDGTNETLIRKLDF